MIATQGIQGIAFFEATACLTLLVLFVHLKRDNPGVFYKLWLFGWISLTVAANWAIFSVTLRRFTLWQRHRGLARWYCSLLPLCS